MIIMSNLRGIHHGDFEEFVATFFRCAKHPFDSAPVQIAVVLHLQLEHNMLPPRYDGCSEF
jgi:hypothetical protein